ncbi:arsenate reductase (glutaredoxin) [Shewanella surugensis]|uniref:Arsenate reductase n=1 Tax=Shewanella surugensis TaxID=212020 RepID=A0ABT0LGY0_9GAMM|nr:arsenate reductase (glutaredoxin) [Shewanella surugensis]MCL1126962.1 arsenate reductase (glutaredoxin) [Shewanella surugensis]
MTQVSIYHNPRCSKSRQTLTLLEENNAQITIIEYLKNPPSEQTLTHILTLLGLTPRELMRKKEAEYKALSLDDETLSNHALIQAMVQNPKLIERPIVLANNQAVIGRPPENVLTLLPLD